MATMRTGLGTRALGALGFRIREGGGKEKRRPGVPVHVRGTASAALWGELNEPGVYTEQARRYTTSDLVYMCVNRIAEMAAMDAHRLMLFDPASPRDPETGFPTETIDDHPFLDLWRKPNPWDSMFEFLEATMIFNQVNGTAFWHADDGSPRTMHNGNWWVIPEGEPLNLWVLRPDRIWIEPSVTEYISAYKYDVGGQITYIHPSLIRHYKRFHPLRDFEGLSPNEPANFAVTSDVAAQRSNVSLYKNSMRLSGIVESDAETVDEDQLSLMEKEMREKYTGSPDKAHQLAFLWSGFKYRELGMNMRDAEFIEAQKMNRMRIFGVFGVHPAVVLAEDVNLANAKIGEYVTLKYTVAPALERIASDMGGLMELWKDAPPAEAHFVGVVPQDREAEAKVAVAKGQATESFIRALGPEEGVAEAQRQGVLSADVNPAKVFASAPVPQISATESTKPYAGGNPSDLEKAGLIKPGEMDTPTEDNASGKFFRFKNYP